MVFLVSIMNRIVLSLVRVCLVFLVVLLALILISLWFVLHLCILLLAVPLLGLLVVFRNSCLTFIILNHLHRILFWVSRVLMGHLVGRCLCFDLLHSVLL